MAKRNETTVEQVRVLKRGGGAAATFAFFALVLAVIALLFAVRAQNRAQHALNQTKDNLNRIHSLSTKVDNAVSAFNKASIGAGTDQNVSVPTPTANGQ